MVGYRIPVPTFPPTQTSVPIPSYEECKSLKPHNIELQSPIYDPWRTVHVVGKAVEAIRRMEFQYGCDRFGIYDDGSFHFDKAFSEMNVLSDGGKLNQSKKNAMHLFFQTYVARYLLFKYPGRTRSYYLEHYQPNQLVWVKLAYCYFVDNDLSREPVVLFCHQVFDIATYYRPRREIGREAVNGCLYKHHPKQVYEKTD